MIIAVADKNASVRPLAEQAELVAEAKPDMMILKGDGMSDEEYRTVAKEIAEICGRHGVEFCASAHIPVAAALGVKNLCISVESLEGSVPEGFDKVFVHAASEREAADAERRGAYAVIFGNVFDLSCKSCRNAKGLSTLRCLTGTVDIPVIGAGGILPDVFFEVLSSEAAGVCMTGGFMRSKDPSAVVKAYRDARVRLKL
ncbi:MAG: thiamine phosphate synthase [Candidatus Methanoplasma sp.]|jgi:thiamine-phosphate pyrophosphorylase|nr:thiamine phosphate synthase [Candidatus Methanoplasma sp.]